MFRNLPLTYEQTAEAQEQIARGEHCPACFAIWKRISPDEPTRELRHTPQCAYVEAVERFDA